MSDATGPSGREWAIRHGAHEARVVAVGGALRSYTHDGVDVLAGFAADEASPAMRGKLLVPWPNRIRDGRYAFDGTQYELGLSEPARHNAAHGLVLWHAWEADEVGEASVTLRTAIHPQPGYPALLDVRVTYSLDDDGLTSTLRVRNDADVAGPFGFAAHPYLTAGESRVDDLELTLPAARYLPVDPDRLLPVSEPVDVDDAHRLDGRPLGERAFDTAFTALRPDDDGRWRARLHDPASGRSTTLWAEAAAFGWAQLFTGDELPEPFRRRSGLALEPTTCPPDAFNSGVDVVRLEPGATWSGTWGVTPGRATDAHLHDTPATR